MALRVAYHDACHLAHAQGIRGQPRRLLESIPGVSLVPLAEPEICCGSAGIFNLVQPDLASALGRRKAAAVASASPDAVATSNPGCMLQISAQLEADGNPDHARIRVLHVMEILDASIRASGMP
jgi:glycolate oxidase iron-sulfur subunit